MIQVPFHSSCVAVQYKTKTKFFHRVVPELHGIKNRKISVQPRGILHVVLEVESSVLMIYPVNAKEGSALQVSRDQTSFIWLVSFSIQTFKKESGWYSLACVRLASNPGSLGIQG